MKTKWMLVGVVLCAVFVGWSYLAVGQADDIPPVPVERPQAAPVAEAPAEPVAPAPAPQPRAPEQIELATQTDVPGFDVGTEEGDDLITISLDNAPLTDVVRMFSRISGANIVAGTNLVGNVTVSMHDVPWEPALRAILDSVDLVLVEKMRNIYSIVSKSDLAAEPVTVETIFLEYGSVSNVVPVVRQMLVSTNASVSSFPSANALVVQETAQRLNEIRQTVRAIDRPRSQVFIETKFIELNDQAIETLGLDWQVLQGYTVGASNLRAGYERQRTHGYENRDNLTQFREDGRFRTSVSARGDESTTRSRFFDSSGSLASTFGGGQDIQGSLRGINAIPSFDPGSPPDTPPSFELGNVEPRFERDRTSLSEGRSEATGELRETFTRSRSAFDINDVTRFYGAVLGADDLAVTLSALQEMDGVSVVSNPKLVVANGETATIHVGRNEPNVTAVPQGDTGDRFAIALDDANPYIEIGVKLEVTPTIHTEDNIGLKIVPELSRKVGDLQVGIVGISYPITQIRKITTEFSVPSGRTVAIGGLTETRDSESINKVPLLGDLPVIGKYLFQHRRTEKLQDEVVIFVTVGLAASRDMAEVSGIPSEGQLIHRHLANKAAQAAIAAP